MQQKRFSDEQIIGILKEADAGMVVADLCRKHGMSSTTFYAWKAKYGGLELSGAKRLRGLEEVSRIAETRSVCGWHRGRGPDVSSVSQSAR